MFTSVEKPVDPVSAFIVETADAASTLAIQDFRANLGTSKSHEKKGVKGGRLDFVLPTDIKLQHNILAAIAERYPADGFLSEEKGGKKEAASNARWVLDPIDGTGAFKTGDDVWACCALARQEKKGDEWKTTHSVLSVPVQGITYFADDNGAYIRNANVFGDSSFHHTGALRGKWAEPATPPKTLLHGMTLNLRLVDEEQAEDAVRQRLRGIHKYSHRITGCIAAALAKGAIMEPGTYALAGGKQKLWDWAAGGHILQQAGFQCEERTFPGLGTNNTDYKVVLAAENPKVTDALAGEIERGLRAVRMQEMQAGRAQK